MIKTRHTVVSAAVLLLMFTLGTAAQEETARNGAATAQSSTSTVTFSTPPDATQQIEILGGKAAVSINPARWTEVPSTDPIRRTFKHAKSYAYATIIHEPVQVPMELMPSIAFANANKGDADTEIVEQQMRRVNGTDILLLRINTQYKGIPLTYLGYYYSGLAGSVQVITNTSQSLLEEYRSDLEEFLNGFSLN